MGRRVRARVLPAAARLMAKTAARQLSRHREFRFHFHPARLDGVRLDVRARHRSFAAELALRPRSSDVRTFEQIFLEGFYDLRGLACGAALGERYDRMRARGARPWVLDLGANVGLASLYFAAQWPEAAILALEPETGNYRRLEHHFRRYRGPAVLNALQAGAAARDGHLAIANPGGATAGFRTRAAAAGAPDAWPAFSIPTLLQRQGTAVPWIVKIDVEGAERELFSDPSWLDRFPVLVVEPHDWMRPGEAHSAPLVKALAARPRDLLVLGESLVSIAWNPLPDPV